MVGPSVGGLKRCLVAIVPDEDEWRRVRSRGNGGVLRPMPCRWGRGQIAHRCTQPRELFSRGPTGRGSKSAGYSKRGAVDHFGRRSSHILLGSSTQAQQHPWQLVEPCGRGEPCSQGGLERAMKSLNKPIGLRVISRRVMDPGAQELVQAGPQLGDELRPAIGGDVERHTKHGNPVPRNGAGALRSVGGNQGNGLGPPGVAVYDGEEVGKAPRRWQWPNKVNMYVREPRLRRRKLLQWGLDMPVHLCPLALLAGSSPLAHLLGQSMPYELGCDELDGGIGAWVRQVVHRLEHLAAVGVWNKRAGPACGDITQQPAACLADWHVVPS